MDIHAWISTLVWIIENLLPKIMDTHVDIVDFWKSMHGFAMDSRIKVTFHRVEQGNCTFLQ